MGNVLEGGWECKDFKSQRRFYLLEMSEATPIESHKHGCLSMSWTRRRTDTVKWKSMGRPLRPQPCTKTRGNYGTLRTGEISLPEGRAHPIPIPMVSPEDRYTSNIIQTEQSTFMYLGIVYTHL